MFVIRALAGQHIPSERLRRFRLVAHPTLLAGVQDREPHQRLEWPTGMGVYTLAVCATLLGEIRQNVSIALLIRIRSEPHFEV